MICCQQVYLHIQISTIFTTSHDWKLKISTNLIGSIIQEKNLIVLGERGRRCSFFCNIRVSYVSARYSSSDSIVSENPRSDLIDCYVKTADALNEVRRRGFVCLFVCVCEHWMLAATRWKSLIDLYRNSWPKTPDLTSHPSHTHTTHSTLHTPPRCRCIYCTALLLSAAAVMLRALTTLCLLLHPCYSSGTCITLLHPDFSLIGICIFSINKSTFVK